MLVQRPPIDERRRRLLPPMMSALFGNPIRLDRQPDSIF
jgi:hypothetical protein